MNAKVAPIKDRTAKIEEFLTTVAEEIDSDPRQMILITRRRDRRIAYQMLEPGDYTLDTVATLEWVKLNMFEDFAETSERKV